MVLGVVRYLCQFLWCLYLMLTLVKVGEWPSFESIKINQLVLFLVTRRDNKYQYSCF